MNENTRAYSQMLFVCVCIFVRSNVHPTVKRCIINFLCVCFNPYVKIRKLMKPCEIYILNSLNRLYFFNLHVYKYRINLIFNTTLSSVYILHFSCFCEIVNCGRRIHGLLNIHIINSDTATFTKD